MSNQTTAPLVFEIDRHTNLGREIIRAVLLDSQDDHVSDSEIEETFQESYAEEEYQEEGEDGNNDDEEVEDDHGNNHRKSIENLEEVKINEESLMCPICLEEITPSNKEEKEGAVRIPKPCGHVFHHNCILKWLINHHTCPLCRFNLTTSQSFNPKMPV